MDPRILIFMLSALISTVTSELEDITTIYRIHQPLHPSSSEELTLASHVIHLRTNVLGKLLREDIGSYLRPSVGMPQFHCVPVTPNCSWIQTDEWTIKDTNMDDVLPQLEVSSAVTCKIHNGGCQAYCQESQEGFVVCTCPTNYELNFDEKTCRGSGPHNYVLDDKSGQFSSFNHPQKYDHNMFITWMLVVPEHHHITLEFESFLTESCCDFLEVYDGLDLSSPKLAKLSGSSLPNPLHSTGNAMFLTFKSDGSTSYEGFRIQYTTESPGQDVLYSNKGGSLRSLLFRPNDMHLCVSLIYNVGNLHIKPWVSAEVANQHILNLTETTSSEYGEWKIGRFKATLKPSQMGSFLSLYVQFQVPSSVYSIMRCNPYDDEDVYVKDNSVNLASFEKPLISPDLVEAFSASSSECKNGGVRIKGEEECQCPAGIAGADCEEPCGSNSYGKDCGGKCSGFERGCHKMIFCKKYLPCMCAPGFEGIFCDDKCLPGKYGANCWLTCGHCSTDACDIYSGDCIDGCKVGYYPPHCQEKYTQLASPPIIEYRDLLSVTIKSNRSDTVGRGNPKFYHVQYKEKTASNWIDWPPQLLKEPIIEANITDLKPGLHYARIMLIDEDGNSNDENEVPIVEFETLCVVPTSKEYHLVVTNITSSSFEITWQYDPVTPTWCPVTGYEITFRSRWQKLKYNVSSEEMVVNFSGLLAGELYNVQVKAMTEHGYGPRSTPITVTTLDRAPGEVINLQTKAKSVGELLVTWKVPRFSGGTVRQYRVEYECIKLLACSASCYNSASHIFVSAESVLLKDLYPHAQYRIKVAAMSAALGPYRSVIVATNHSAPTVAPDPSPVPVKHRTNTSLIVEWRAPSNCLGLNGYHYGYKYQVVSNEQIIRNGTTQHTHINITDLIPHTPYEIWVHIISSGGWSNDHKLVIYAVTSASVSEPVQDLRVYKKGRHMIGIRWAKPFNNYGSILSFTVSYQLLGPSPSKKVSEVIEPVHCIAWPDLYCHTLNGLKPDTYYEVTVQARNSEVNNYGAGKSVTDVTKESAPGAPTSLEVVNRTQTGMLIQWGPPWFINGVLRSFILNVEETDSRNSSNCCQYFPIQELPIQTEQQLYRLDVGGLKPSSTFAFSISAKTVTLGPSLNITASTPPEPPALVHPPRLINRLEDDPIKVLIQPEGSYPGLRSTYLLLVITPDDTEHEAEFWDWELQAQIQQLVNESFYAVAEFPSSTFTQEKTFVLGTGTIQRNGTYSVLENRGFSSGSYRPALALILDYCGATSVGVAVGDSFTVS